MARCKIGTGRDAASESGERPPGEESTASRPKASGLGRARGPRLAHRRRWIGLFHRGANARGVFRWLVFGRSGAAGASRSGMRAMRERLKLLREGAAMRPAQNPRSGEGFLCFFSFFAPCRAGSPLSMRAEAVAAADPRCATTRGPFPQARLARRGSRSIAGSIRCRRLPPKRSFAADFTPSVARWRQLTTSFGPHRYDIAVQHVGRGMQAALCSTGEKKGCCWHLLARAGPGDANGSRADHAPG